MITLRTDYVGQYKVAKDCFDDLDLYIAKYEPIYLKQLMGASLYALFNADLTGPSPQIPQNSPYIVIFNPFDTDDNGCLRTSEGIRKMLVQFIYFEFTRNSSHKHTASGVVINQVEVSDPTPYNGYNLVEAYNQAVTNYHAIQWYINDNVTDYPTENMQALDFISGI